MFNQLPLEIQSHIIGYNPHMQQLNKTYRQTTRNYFYDKFCNSPISQNEFFHYVKLFKPVQFALFVDKGEHFRILLFNQYNHFYQLTIYHLYITEIDVGEYKINYDYTQLHMDTFTNLIQTISHHFKHDMMYDVQLSLDILDERVQCTDINPRYSYVYMQHNFMQNVKETAGGDLSFIFNLIKKLWYMIMSYKIMNEENTENVIDELYFIQLDEMIFNEMGQLVNNDDIKELEEEYKNYYDIIMTHLTKETI
jgi:hypothetical protein